MFGNIFYLSTSLAALWRNPGCDWAAWACLSYVGRCCSIPSCIPTTVAVSEGSRLDSPEWFVKDAQP